MAERSIFTDREIAFLQELEKRKVQFIIVGAAAAALQGAPVVTQDIDLWFKDAKDPKLKEAIKAVGGALVAPVGLNPPLLAGEGLRLFDVVLTMHGLGEFSKELHQTLLMSLGPAKVRVLRLERIIKIKEALGRPKDILILPALRDALVTIKAKKRLGKKRKT